MSVQDDEESDGSVSSTCDEPEVLKKEGAVQGKKNLKLKSVYQLNQKMISSYPTRINKGHIEDIIYNGN